jgi:GalNAc5-diNAcBac-PP-undecaprenol beta-1,3-glucosyltransferase
MRPEATIIVPTHNHGALLRASVSSALQQTVAVEVLIVGDGVDDETRLVATELARTPAVRFLDYPKGPRHGEIHRHLAVTEARGRIVCYLADDDLYVPHHVEHICERMEGADFVHAIGVRVAPEGSATAWTVDLADAAFRRELLAGRNRIPLSTGSHTLAFYRSLPEGWTTAPPDLPTDLHMWQKFLRRPDCRFRSGRWPTVYVFPTPLRRHMTITQRREELEEWRLRLSSSTGIAKVEREVLAQKCGEAAALEALVLAATGDSQVAPTRTVFQVFFPCDSEYSEVASVRSEIVTGVWERVVFHIPTGESVAPIRIDPSSHPGTIRFASLELRDCDGALLWALTARTASEISLSIELSQTADPLVFVSSGYDPQLYLPVVPGSNSMEIRAELQIDCEIPMSPPRPSRA